MLQSGQIELDPGRPLPHGSLLPSLEQQPDPLPWQLQRWLWLLVGLGVAARVLRWALCWPLWGDEAFLSANFLHRGYGDMFGPLEYHQVCPLLVLWAQLTMVKLWGFSEYGLRFFPLLCSLAALGLFWKFARRFVSGTAFVLAVGIFATTYPLLRYAAEAKQYGCDMLVSLVLLTVTVQWWRRPERAGWLVVLVAITPLAIAGSYPAVFTAGGVSLALAVFLWRAPQRCGWLLWLAYNVVLVLSFGGCFYLYVRHQSQADLQGMQTYWNEGFPPLNSLTKFVQWFVETHAGELMPHPIGGPRGRSAVTFLCCLLAVVLLVRRRQWPLLILCLAPAGLNFAAAVAHRYPYGQHVRMAMYLAPQVCLLAGMGLAAVIETLQRRGPAWGRILPAVLALLALIPLISISRDFATQGKSEEDISARCFARWFWPELAREGEVVCLKSDLNRVFSSQGFQLGCSALYLCNQRIYSPRHAAQLPPQEHRVSAQWPLLYVRYRSSQFPDDEAAVSQWLQEVEQKYTIARRDEYPQRHSLGRGHSLAIDTVEVYRCVPK